MDLVHEFTYTAQLAEAGFPEEAWGGIKELFRPVGCASCAKTGFRGRMGLYEVMPVSEEIERLVVDRSFGGRYRHARKHHLRGRTVRGRGLRRDLDLAGRDDLDQTDRSDQRRRVRASRGG